MKLYNFSINNFEYQNGRKISRTVIPTNDNQYYCTSKDMNAISDYLNGLKIQISGLTNDYNENFLKISGDLYNEITVENTQNTGKFATYTWCLDKFYQKQDLYTKSQCDDMFALKSNVYTKNDSDNRFALKSNVYTKPEVYTKTESDGKFQPITDHSMFLMGPDYTRSTDGGKILNNNDNDNKTSISRLYI